MRSTSLPIGGSRPRQVQDGVVLGQQHDGNVRLVSKAAVPRDVRRSVGAEDLASRVEDKPPARVTDDGRATRECDVVELHRAQTELLIVSQHVNPRAKLGQRPRGGQAGAQGRRGASADHARLNIDGAQGLRGHLRARTSSLAAESTVSGE